MSKVNLSVIGLSPQEGTVVNVVANLLAALDHSVNVLAAGDLSGDIVLISHDSDAGRAALGNLGKEQRAVLFVDNEGEIRGYPTLIRPVRVQTLRDLLVDLVPSLPQRSAAAPAPAVTPVAKPASAAPAKAQPATLFYLLLDAAIDHSLLSVTGSQGEVVLLHGPTQCIYTRADGPALEALAKQAPEALQTQRLNESDFMRATKGMSLIRQHDLIWLAERHGARGALLQGHSSEVPVRLKLWPKFNSRHVRPEYLKLAALLSKQPLTLRALAETSGVALSQVIDFYNASVAFGVIEKMESAPVVTPPPKTSGSGLLGKIAKRLALKRD